MSSTAINSVAVVACQCHEIGANRQDCEQNSGRCLCIKGVTGECGNMVLVIP